MPENGNDFKQKISDLKKDDLWHQELAKKIMTSEKAVSYKNKHQARILFTTALLTSLCAVVFTIGFFLFHDKPPREIVVKLSEIQTDQVKLEAIKTSINVGKLPQEVLVQDVEIHAEVEEYIASEVLETYNEVFSDTPDLQIEKVNYITEK